ncbi:MAG: DegV family protein, partial [Dehalococcoidia bacterium]
SVACIPRELAEEYKIAVFPAANIHINGETYIDGVTISPTQAYDFIRKDPDRFITSALAPGDVVSEFRKIESRVESILVITMSSALSALFKTVTLAADSFQEQSPGTSIRVWDSRTCAGAQGLVVLAAAKAAAQGMTMDQVADVAEKVREETGGIMLLDTLRYIYRTGRMSKTASRLASILNIRPINWLTDEGKVEFLGRARKREDGMKRLVELVKEKADSDSLHFLVSHAAAPGMADRVIELLRQDFNCLSLTLSEYSPVMGYGAGPGSIFVGFQPELDLFNG